MTNKYCNEFVIFFFHIKIHNSQVEIIFKRLKFF